MAEEGEFGSVREESLTTTTPKSTTVKINRSLTSSFACSVTMLLLCLSLFVASGSGFLFPYPRGNDLQGNGDVGKKLILTPYIESGKLVEARELSQVKPLKGKVESYSGYVTVDKKCDSNLFFWFFPTESNDKKAPVGVWLQGGPGASSMYGLFSENGPFHLTPENKLKLRKYSWTKTASYIFIDNPVGTGFSYTSSTDCYSRNETEVGKNLLSAVKQILKLFPEYKDNPFFVTGESYGGKYVPALAYAIHKDTDKQTKINLQGLAIGNGLVDPENQLIYSDYLYQLGLVDVHGRDYFKQEEDKCKGLINNKKWKEAFLCFDSVLDGDKTKEPTYFQNVTGFKFYFNYLWAVNPPEGDLNVFFSKDYVRKAIHVGNATFHNGSLVEDYLMEDVMQSVRPWVEELLEHYRVLIYNGQLDIIVAYPLTLGYLQKMQWSGANEYKTATRHIWKVNNTVAGYAKKAGNLTEVLVRNAGHMVPADQPFWAFDLISRFFYNKPFY